MGKNNYEIAPYDQDAFMTDRGGVKNFLTSYGPDGLEYFLLKLDCDGFVIFSTGDGGYTVITDLDEEC